MLVNKKAYNVPKEGRPVVGILLDGTSQEYIDVATKAGLMPNWNGIVTRNANKGVQALVSMLTPFLQASLLFISVTSFVFPFFLEAASYLLLAYL